MSNSTFWKNVKDLLTFNGILNKELAAKTEMNLGTLNNQISANKLPDLESAYKIAQVLNVSLEYLLTGKSSKQNDPNISYEDKNLLESYHRLSEHDKKVLKTIISTMTIADEITPDGNNYVFVEKD